MRVFLGAFGDPGHAFPMLALGEALIARGHSVALQTWRRWQEPAEAAGIAFAAAPEYQVFPTRERPLKPYQAAVAAARETVPAVEAFAPDIAVSDVLTPAPALAAELAGVPVATLVPHVHPWAAPGFPPFAVGARRPRTPAGAWLWRRFDGVVDRGLERGREEYNDCRARLGLPPLPGVHTGMSRALTLVGTLPQLEYPRDWAPWLRVVGALLWEPPGERVAPPPGDGPVVMVAPSTAQDPEHALLRAALAGLARRTGPRRRHLQRPRSRRDRRARERGARAVAVLRALDARVRRRRHARRPRDARARALLRLRPRRLPRRRRHGRERGARGLGGARRPAPAPAARAGDAPSRRRAGARRRGHARARPGHLVMDATP